LKIKLDIINPRRRWCWF